MPASEKFRIGGVLGGMGVDVTGELLDRVIALTDAEREQDHIPLLINHNPGVPDRTGAILHGGADPLPHLRDAVDRLVRAGAAFIGIPCNTAHYFYDALQADTPVPIIHMLRETVSECLRVRPGLRTVGILATTGTVRSGLYQELFEAEGVALRVPEDADQEAVMNGIMAIKARRDLPPIRQSMLDVSTRLVESGAGLILIGCTDISVAVKEGDLETPIVDALTVLARSIIRRATESAHE
ncbi:MAG: amino acid racemase [bacterium]|nr:amino acid racemase [bacterium]